MRPRPPAVLPPYAGRLLSSDSDDDDIQALAAPPRHLRKKKNNASQPIAVLDSDDEAGSPRRGATKFSTPTKQRARGTAEASESRNPGPSKRREPSLPPLPPPKRQRILTSQEGHHIEENPYPLPIANAFALQSPPPDPADLLPAVLDVLPDLCPNWALLSLTTEVQDGRGSLAVPKVVELALEMGDYPKYVLASVVDKGKGKEKEKEDLGSYRQTEYRISQRCGPAYEARCIAELEAIFVKIPVPQ
jgi:hypothetical protein